MTIALNSDKGIEMVTALCGYYAPTGKVATFINFRGLVDLEMKDDEPVRAFLARVQDAESNLHEDGLDLDPTLITLFFLNGLSARFQPIRQSFTSTARSMVNWMSTIYRTSASPTRWYWKWRAT